MLNISNGDSAAIARPRPVLQGLRTACLMPNGNDVLYHALTEALKISEEMERLLTEEIVQAKQTDTLARSHGSKQ